MQNIGAKTKTGVLFRFGQIESQNSFDFFFFKAMPLVERVQFEIVEDQIVESKGGGIAILLHRK